MMRIVIIATATLFASVCCTTWFIIIIIFYRIKAVLSCTSNMGKVMDIEKRTLMDSLPWIVTSPGRERRRPRMSWALLPCGQTTDKYILLYFLNEPKIWRCISSSAEIFKNMFCYVLFIFVLLPSHSKTMKLSKTGIKAVEKTGTASAAAPTRKTPTASCSALQRPNNICGENSKPPNLGIFFFCIQLIITIHKAHLSSYNLSIKTQGIKSARKHSPNYLFMQIFWAPSRHASHEAGKNQSSWQRPGGGAISRQHWIKLRTCHPRPEACLEPTWKRRSTCQTGQGQLRWHQLVPFFVWHGVTWCHHASRFMKHIQNITKSYTVLHCKHIVLRQFLPIRRRVRDLQCVCVTQPNVQRTWTPQTMSSRGRSKRFSCPTQ